MTVSDIAPRLPSIDVLRDRCKALAVVERILDAGEGYYSYTTSWGPDEAALMSNGSGDEWAIVFTEAGAFIRVFDHESPLSPYTNPDRSLAPGLLDGLPEVFRPHVREEAFSDGDGHLLATAVLWRPAADDRWHTGSGPDDDDGSELLEILFDDIVDEYVEFAEDYYEIDVDRAAVEHVVARRPLTDAVVRALNPEASLAALRADLDGIAVLG